jgi:hypothetical protein
VGAAGASEGVAGAGGDGVDLAAAVVDGPGVLGVGEDVVTLAGSGPLPSPPFGAEVEFVDGFVVPGVSVESLVFGLATDSAGVERSFALELG